MKIAKLESNPNFRKEEAPLPLVPIEDEERNNDKSKTIAFKLRTNPTDANSTVYSYTTLILDGTCSTRDALKWYPDVTRVLTGLNITSAAAKHQMIKRMCRDSVETAYENEVAKGQLARQRYNARQASRSLTKGATESDPDFESRQQQVYNAAMDLANLPQIEDGDIIAGLQAIIKHLSPFKVLAKQKRFMRRKMRKPADMKTRTYANHLLRINHSELPQLPPNFNTAQSLGEDEILDIVLHGVPNSWRKKMDEHDFDPHVGTLEDLINFCERMESAETHENATDKQLVNGRIPKKKKNSYKKPSSSDDATGKWCEFHETDTHTTSECETLKRLKRERANGGSKKGNFKNKTWKRQSSDAKSFTKKELAAIAEKAVRKAQREQLNAISKRKVDDSSDSSDGEINEKDDNSSVSSTASLNALETKMKDVDNELAEFSFDGKAKNSVDA